MHKIQNKYKVNSRKYWERNVFVNNQRKNANVCSHKFMTCSETFFQQKLHPCPFKNVFLKHLCIFTNTYIHIHIHTYFSCT